MAGPAVICIGADRRRPFEILGLKIFSSLQGPAGKVLTICRETCVVAIATVIDIGNGFGSKPAMLAATEARGPGRPQLGSSMSPPSSETVDSCAASTERLLCHEAAIGRLQSTSPWQREKSRSACSHHAEQARHRSDKIDDVLQILPVSPSDATRHPSLNFLGSKIN